MEMLENGEFLKGKTVVWAGVVPNRNTGDAEFVMCFTDDTVCTVGAWQLEGYLTEMSVEVTSS